MQRKRTDVSYKLSILHLISNVAVKKWPFQNILLFTPLLTTERRPLFWGMWLSTSGIFACLISSSMTFFSPVIFYSLQCLLISVHLIATLEETLSFHICLTCYITSLRPKTKKILWWTMDDYDDGFTTTTLSKSIMIMCIYSLAIKTDHNNAIL